VLAPTEVHRIAYAWFCFSYATTTSAASKTSRPASASVPVAVSEPPSVPAALASTPEPSTELPPQAGARRPAEEKMSARPPICRMVFIAKSSSRCVVASLAARPSVYARKAWLAAAFTLQTGGA
jgi:hypothetical protein